MIDPNAPTFPTTAEHYGYPKDVLGGPGYPAFPGLTIRAHFAALAMEALIPGFYGHDIKPDSDSLKALHDNIAAHSVLIADAMIEALNNTERSNGK